MRNRGLVAGMLAEAVLAATLLVGGLALGAEDHEVRIVGAGTTAPWQLYPKWFDAYQKLHPQIKIDFKEIGSGGGIKAITDGTTDFGAIDGPMSDQTVKSFNENRGSNVLHFPVLVRGAVPIYNIPGVAGEIKFTGKALSGIYLGTISKWNDPQIQKANPEVKLPDNDIVAVHRSDGNGMTLIWTDYLCKVSKEWKEKVGEAAVVQWAVGLDGKGDAGVAALVQETPNSVGYVELRYAIQNKVNYGSVQNAAGKFIKADVKSLTAAVAGAAKEMPEDFRALPTNAPGDQSYPITGFIWLMVPDQIKDAASRKAVVDLFRWILTDGQKLIEGTHFAPLPPAMVEREMKAIEKIGG